MNEDSQQQSCANFLCEIPFAGVLRGVTKTAGAHLQGQGLGVPREDRHVGQARLRDGFAARGRGEAGGGGPAAGGASDFVPMDGLHWGGGR